MNTRLGFAQATCILAAFVIALLTFKEISVNIPYFSEDRGLLAIDALGDNSSAIENDPNNDFIDEFTLSTYQVQLSERKKMLHWKEFGFSVLYTILAPEVQCRNLVRLGTLWDGGKWICAPNRIGAEDKCVFYSLGIRDEISFDAEFQAAAGQKCLYRAVDMKKQKNETLTAIADIGGQFLQAEVANVTDMNEGKMSFTDIVRHFGDEKIDVLKVDIEGSEYDVIQHFTAVPVCQILIEVHGFTALDARRVANLLVELSLNGFYLYSFESNPIRFFIREYSFIHGDCLKRHGVKTVLGKWLS